MPSTNSLTGVSVPADYTSRDYQSILSDLLNAIPTYLPEWTSTSPNDLGIALLELFSYVADIENFYIDRVANESFLATAQQRSSVLNLAYLIDYAPQGAAPATTTLTITMNTGNPAITLPVGTQFSTASTSTQKPIIFETSKAVAIPANSGSVTVPVVQGVTINSEQVGTSTGNANQTFTLYNTGVIENTVQIFVDEGAGPKPWAMVGNLIDSGPYDAAFALAIDANGVVYINFGDNTNGRIPNPSAVITASYRIGGGTVGNVGAGQIVVNLSGNGYIASVTNASPAVGGADPETIAQIQVNAPQSLTATDRCVSQQDYAAVSMNVPGVSKAQALASVLGTVTLYVHPAGGPYQVGTLNTLVQQLAPSITWGGAGPSAPTGSYPITGVTFTGSGPYTVTYTSTLPAAIGQPVTVSGVGGVNGVNGNFIISAVGTGTFSVTIPTGVSGAYTSGGTVYFTSPAGYLDSRKMAGTTITVVPAASATPPTYTITGVTYSGTTVTFTSSAPVSVGQSVTVASVGGVTNVNGTWTVTAVGTGTFTVVVTTTPTGAYTSGGTAQPATGYVQVVITMTVTVLPQYSPAQVQQDVTTAINTLLDFGSMTFSQRVTLSSVYHTVQAVSGVDYVTITEMRRADAAAGTLGDVVCGIGEIPVAYNPDNVSNPSLITINTNGGL